MNSDGPGSAELIMRPVVKGDRRRIWELSNDPDARGRSFDPEAIAWSDHVAWFAAQLANPLSHIYIVESPMGIAAGVVRFEVDNTGAAVVSVVIDRRRRGAGLGSKAIREGCSRVQVDSGVERVYAFIKPDNEQSIRAFEKAGFSPTTVPSHDGAFAMVWEDGER
jgi:UDP-2,4-diacetamido-2,4,6-trideoxy-beta-L-altropyranose hydrolase